VATEDVIARLRAEGEGAFTQAFGRARDSIRGVSTEGEESEKGMAGAGKSLLGAASAAVVAKKGYDSLKGAIDTTADLAKSTASFSRASGLSAKESQNWITVAKTRGIETSQLQMGMAAFGRQLAATGKDGEGSSKALARLGVDQKALLAMPMAERMSHISNAFAAMPDGVEKAAAAQQLFGRSGQQLLPLLNSGAEGLQDNLDAANRLVPSLGNSGQAALDMAKKQREMQMALTGVKTTIGTALIPILSSLLGVIAPVIASVSALLNKVPGLSAAVVVLGTAFAGLLLVNKVLSLLKAFGLLQETVTIKTMAQSVATGIATAAEWAWNAAKAVGAALMAVSLGWILLIVAAVAAVVVGIVLLAKNWSTVWSAVKGAIGAAASFIGDRVSDIVGWFTSLPGKIGSALSSRVSVVGNAFKAAAAAAWKQFTWLIDQIKKLPSIVAGFIGSLGSSIGETLKGAVKSVLPGPLASLLATGGVIAAQTGLTAGGGKNVLVGERGPEMLSLPSGSRVTPLPPPALAGSQLGGGEQTVIAQVFLDRRQIAEAQASYVADRQASR
jgi:hypothetical protein